MSTHRSPGWDVDATILSPQTGIIVCCGSGGVGKTTVAAAIALRAAEAGRHVAVLTIDPARRLAQALGMSELDNEPRRVEGVQGDGTLDAITLDMKRTFDDVVRGHASPERAEQIFANPFYQSLSSSLSGTQEYMAMEKLGQLRAEGRWDLIVVDTPPSRSALDFLDAPHRLSHFLDGRMIRLLAAPARASGRAYLRMVGVSMTLFSRATTKILGTQLLTDVAALVGALDTTFGGFRKRAEATYELLKQPGTAFVVVAIAEPDALREASYFVNRLASDDMPLAGLIVNRMQNVHVPSLSAERAHTAAEDLSASGDHALTAAALRLHAKSMALRTRQRQLTERLRRAHPTVGLADIPAMPEDVHDLSALRHVSTALTQSSPSRRHDIHGAVQQGPA